MIEFKLFDVNMNFDEGYEGGGTGQEKNVFAPKSVTELLSFSTTYKKFRDALNSKETKKEVRINLGDGQESVPSQQQSVPSNEGELELEGGAKLSVQFIRQIEGFNFMTGDKKVSV